MPSVSCYSERNIINPVIGGNTLNISTKYLAIIATLIVITVKYTCKNLFTHINMFISK